MQKVISFQNVGCLDQYAKGGQNLNPIHEFPEVPPLDLSEFFSERNFTSIDPWMREWFDLSVQDAPAVAFQQYSLDNYIGDGTGGFSSPGGSTLENRYRLSQNGLIDFVMKKDLYLEVTLGQIAFFLGYPNYYNGVLSDWSGKDTFLLRKKDGTLCWLQFDINDGDLFCNIPEHDIIRLYDFEPNAGIPSSFFFFKPSDGLCAETIT